MNKSLKRTIEVALVIVICTAVIVAIGGDKELELIGSRLTRNMLMREQTSKRLKKKAMWTTLRQAAMK